jgi:hypothetical protein
MTDTTASPGDVSDRPTAGTLGQLGAAWATDVVPTKLGEVPRVRTALSARDHRAR